MRLPGMKRLKLLARWVRSRVVNGALILGYHRVVDTPQDPYGITVSPQNFAEQLEALRQYANLVPLQELVQTLEDGSLPRRAVVVTFDDGYADNLYCAKPLLERHQIPATVFVATGQIGREFWWDELEYRILSSTEWPGVLSLEITEGSYTWVPAEVGPRQASRSRRHIAQSIYRSLACLFPTEREAAIAELWARLGKVPEDRPSRRALTGDELIDLTGGGLVDIGAHTVTHPMLARLPISVQRQEIQESKVSLERILGRPITSFSYPNGSSSSETRAFVQEAGFHCACGSHNDVGRRGSDLFHLPRFWIPDWDGKAFSRWLRLWLSV